MEMDMTVVVAPPAFKEKPEDDELTKKWQSRIKAALKKQEIFRKRIVHNRKVVAGFNWKAQPDTENFCEPRANLIHSTITGMLPNLYAKNPEISVSQISQDKEYKLFATTLEKVVNRYLDRAGLKKRAKAAVRSALTCSFGVLKVMYQDGSPADPMVVQKLNDARDNLKHVDHLLMTLEDESSRSEQLALKEELEETIASLEEKAEVPLMDGLVIDRIMTEHILIDPSIVEIEDYVNANWLAQVIPMSRKAAEEAFGYKMDGAEIFDSAMPSNRIYRDERKNSGEDSQVCVYEIWDKQTQRVYTMVDGLNFWVREPYCPENVGKRWYPFFILPFQIVDGKIIGPSLVDLTEKLQNEHNRTRDKFNAHRELVKPGYLASADIHEKNLKRFSDAELGEITLIDTEGKPLNQTIIPKQHPPIDVAAYDVSGVRTDWEMVTGLQDAARSSIVKPKTATEANIMQQSLSVRVSEFRDQIEDFLQEIAEYTAEILLLTLGEEDVANVMGQNEFQLVDGIEPVFTKRAYDWTSLPREKVFDLLELKIRAGTTGAPDKMEQQEKWLQFIQVVQPIMLQVMDLQVKGITPTALINLLKETVNRFDDRLEPEDFTPDITQQVQQIQQMQMQQQMQQQQSV